MHHNPKAHNSLLVCEEKSYQIKPFYELLLNNYKMSLLVPFYFHTETSPFLPLLSFPYYKSLVDNKGSVDSYLWG